MQGRTWGKSTAIWGTEGFFAEKSWSLWASDSKWRKLVSSFDSGQNRVNSNARNVKWSIAEDKEREWGENSGAGGWTIRDKKINPHIKNKSCGFVQGEKESWGSK